MRNFFKWAIKLGLRIILLALIIWIIFFSLRHFFPDTFNNISSKFDNKNRSNLSFRYKVYDFLFKDDDKVNNSGENFSDDRRKVVNFYNQESSVWGYSTSSNYNDKSKLNSEDNYIFINKSDQNIAKNFKFDDKLIDADNINYLNSSTTITGNISLDYLSSPYFLVYLYDKDGNYLYSIFGEGVVDEANNSLKVKIYNNNNLNYYNYVGDGFLVIWSDNLQVEGILITKINIQNSSTSAIDDVN